MIVFAFVFSGLVGAGIDSLSFHPAGGIAENFSVWSPRMVEQFQISAGTTMTFQKTSLQVIQQSNVSQEILGQSMIQHFFLTLGLHRRWLELTVELPVAWSVEYTSPSELNPTTENKTLASDTRVYGKMNLLDGPVQFSLMPFLVIPTGAKEQFLGSEIFSGGLYTLTEVMLVPRWSVTANLAFYFREQAKFRNLTATHQAIYGLGTAFHMTKEFFINAELSGKTRLVSPFNKKVDNPIEFMTGLHFISPSEAVRFDLGAGAGLIRGAGVPEFRFLLGFVYKS